MFEPSTWAREWRSDKYQIWKLSADAMPFKMTFVGGSSERYSTHRVDGFNISKVKWRPKRHCIFSKWMEVRVRFTLFHNPISWIPKYGRTAANSDGVPICFVLDASDSTRIWGMRPRGNDTNKALHVLCLMDKSLFGRFRSILGPWLSMSCLRADRRRSPDGGFYLVDFEGSFALGFCDQYRSYDSKMTIKTLNEVRFNSCRAIL